MKLMKLVRGGLGRYQVQALVLSTTNLVNLGGMRYVILSKTVRLWCGPWKLLMQCNFTFK